MKNTNKEVLKLLLKKQLQEYYIKLLNEYRSSYEIYDKLINFYLHNNQFPKPGVININTEIERNGIEKTKKEKLYLNFNHSFDSTIKNKYENYLEYYKNNKQLDYLKSKLTKLDKRKNNLEVFLNSEKNFKEKFLKNLIVNATNYIRNTDEKIGGEVIDFIYDLKDSIPNTNEAAKDQIRDYIAYLKHDTKTKNIKNNIDTHIKYVDENKDLSGRIIKIENELEMLGIFLEQLKDINNNYQIIKNFKNFEDAGKKLKNFENYFENIRKIVIENYTTTKNNKINISELLNKIEELFNFISNIKKEYSINLDYKKYQHIYFDTKNDIISGNDIKYILNHYGEKNNMDNAIEIYLNENKNNLKKELDNLLVEINSTKKHMNKLKKENKQLKKDIKILIENYQKDINNINKETVISMLDGLASDLIKLEEDYRNYVNINFKNYLSEKEMNEIIYKIFVNNVADYIANESEYYEKPKYQKESILKKLEADFYISQNRKLNISNFVTTQKEVEKYPADIFDLLPYIQDIDNIIEKKASKQELLEKLKQKFPDKEINKIKNLIDLYDNIQNQKKKILEYNNSHLNLIQNNNLEI